MHEERQNNGMTRYHSTSSHKQYRLVIILVFSLEFEYEERYTSVVHDVNSETFPSYHQMIFMFSDENQNNALYSES